MATSVYITGTTHNCKECPFRVYYSGGVYECTKTGAHLSHGKAEEGVPEWCPLPLHPAHAITRLERKLHEAEEAMKLAATQRSTPDDRLDPRARRPSIMGRQASLAMDRYRSHDLHYARKLQPEPAPLRRHLVQVD